MRSLRDALNAQLRQNHSKRIAERLMACEEVQRAERIFIYVSFRSEVDTHDLIKSLVILGKDIFIPVITFNNRMQMAQFGAWEDMQTDALGVLVPSNPIIARRHVDVAIVPGLAFSPSGSRIGYGKGHYDRFFSHHPVEIKIGIAFDCQIIPQVPTESSDCSMDYVISESRRWNAVV